MDSQRYMWEIRLLKQEITVILNVDNLCRVCLGLLIGVLKIGSIIG